MERVERTPRATDSVLLLTVILLAGTGVAVLFSTERVDLSAEVAPLAVFLREQRLPLLLAPVAALVAAWVPLSWIRKGAPLVVLASLLLMGITLIPGAAPAVNGTRRWVFPFGVSVQPSEIAKVALILYLAAIFDKKKDRMDDALNTLLPPLLVVLVFVTLTYFQNDYSTAGLLLIVGVALFFVAGVSIVHLGMFVTVAVPLAGMLLFAEEHRVRRIVTFLNPMADPAGAGYQVLAAQRAFAEGGFWGRGLGQGAQKLGALPEAHSDFVYAVVAEEMGFVGALLVILLFAAFAWRGFRIAREAAKSGDTFRYHLAFGITFLLTAQALVNMAMATGLLPTTGIPLPFFSAGGSSLVITLSMCGLLFNAGAIPRDANTLERGGVPTRETL